jgi:hypothetical protein
MKKIATDIDEILHEWHTPKAERILKEMGVSERNWRIFALNGGFADGTKWSYRQLADLEGISENPVDIHITAKPPTHKRKDTA